MTASISLLFVGVLLGTTPVAATPLPRVDADAPNAPNDSSQISDTEAFSAVAGKILGAASACDEINSARVSAAADKALAIASTSTDDESEANSAKELLVNGAAAGREAVESGGADCSVVEASLSTLERVEADDQQEGDEQE
jgi:hypothetical protein